MNEKIAASTNVPALNGAYIYKNCKCANKISVPNVMMGILVILVSIMLIMIPQEGIVTDKNFTSAFYMFGILGSLYGIYKLIAKNSCIVYQPTGSKVVYRQLYYNLDEQDEIEAFISGKAASLPKSSTQGGIRLCTYVSADGSMAIAQISKYHELNYELLGAPVTLTGDRAKVMAEYVKRNK